MYSSFLTANHVFYGPDIKQIRISIVKKKKKK